MLSTVEEKPGIAIHAEWQQSPAFFQLSGFG